MSLLKLIRQQLGISTTPANNFTLDASADNGTMKLAGLLSVVFTIRQEQSR